MKEILKKVLEQHPKHKKLIRAVFREVCEDEFEGIKEHNMNLKGWLGDDGYVEEFYCKHKRDIVCLLSEIALSHGYLTSPIEYIRQNFVNDGYTENEGRRLVQKTLYEKYISNLCADIAIAIVNRIVLVTIATWYVEVKESGFQTIEPASSIDNRNYSWHTNPKNCDDSGRSEFFKKVYPSK